MKLIRNIRKIYRPDDEGEDSKREGSPDKGTREDRSRKRLQKLELEIRTLRRELDRTRQTARRESESASRKIAYLEEMRSALRADVDVLERERETLEGDLDYERRRYELLDEKNRLLFESINSGDEQITTLNPLTVSRNSLEKTNLMLTRGRESDANHNENWLLSYSDFMTLILAVFIVLFTLSTSDKFRFRKVTNEIASTFTGGIKAGLAEGPEAVQGFTDAPGLKSSMTAPEELDTLKREILRSFRDYDLGESLLVDVKKSGVEVTLRENVTFVEGESSLIASSKGILDALAVVLADNVKYDVVVEGHTDDKPIKSERFPSNWELSTSRATNVARYFIEEKGLDPERFTVAGYGEYHPLADNSTELGRAANRRVVLKLIAR